MVALFKSDSPAEKRLSIALIASFAIHAAVVSGVRIAPPERGYSAPLRATLVPLSMPNAPRIDSALSMEAIAELTRNQPIAPRDAEAASTPSVVAPMLSERDRPAPTGIAAELPIYYTNDEVDLRATPRVMTNTSRAEKNLLLGRVIKLRLRLYIGDDGQIDNFEMLHAEGLTPAIGIEDIRDLQFNPAQRGGRPVKSQKVVELTFVP